jgi:parvulin-like peptidyl-prolyl isomerase
MGNAVVQVTRVHGRTPATVFGAVLVAALAVSAGCDKVQGNSQSPATSAPAATASSTAVPRPKVAPGDVVAQVNKGAVSRQDVELVLQNVRATVEAQGQEWKAPTEEELRGLVDGLVLAELKLQDALGRGLDRDPESQRRMLLLARNFYAQEWDRSQLAQIEVTQPEIEQFYEANRLFFRTPERIRVRQMVLPSEEQAKAVLVRLLEGVDFESQAQQSSLQPDAAAGPMVDQWVMRSGEKAVYAPDDETIRELRDPALEQAAFAITKDGGVSSYVEAADGQYHLFQLVERQPASQQPLVEVQDRLRILLQAQRIDEKAKQLRDNAKVDTYPERLSDLQQ